MPGFTQKDGRYFVSYITGPSHVYLGLAFGQSPAEPAMIRQPKLGHCDHGPLDEQRIRDAVFAGVAESQSGLHPTEIIYVEDDSARYDIYQHCAFLLAQRVASGAEFAQNQS
jgi:hypothetical protein